MAEKTDWYTEVTKEPAKAESAALEVDWYREVLEPTQSLTTGPDIGLPHVDKGYRPGSDAPDFSMMDHLRAGMAGNTKDQIKRYSERTGIPVNKFGTINGEIVFWDGKAYIPVVPNVGEGDSIANEFMRVGENVFSATPKAVPSVVGGTVGTLMGPTGASIPAAGVAAGATNAGIQYLDKALAGEETDIDPWSVAGDTALNMGGQLVGNVALKLLTRNKLGISPFERIKAMDPEKLRNAQDLQRMAREEFKIDLSTGQATELRSLLGWERKAGRWDETADDVFAIRDKQWGEQVPAAIRKEIGKLSPQQGEGAVASFRQGADDVVGSAQKAMSDEARVSFGNALDGREPFNTVELDGLMRRPIMSRAWERAKVRAANRDRQLPEYFKLNTKGEIIGTVQKPDWRAWHDIKMSLDDIINDSKNAQGKITGPGSDALLVKRKLMSVLRKENPDYAAALAQYGESADAVDMILGGGIGVLKKSKGLDTAKIVNKVFNEGNIPPQEITRMRQMFYSAGKGDEWNAGVGRWLEGALNKATREFKQGRGNVPGDFFRLVYGTGEQKAITQAALGKDAFSGWDKLLRVLDRARKSLPEGSPTATDIATTAPDAVSTVAQRVGKMASLETYANPGNAIAQGIGNIRQPEARLRLVKYLFGKDGIKELRKLRMLPPYGEKTVKAVADMMAKAGIVGGVDAVGGFISPGATVAAPAEMKSRQQPSQ